MYSSLIPNLQEREVGGNPVNNLHTIYRAQVLTHNYLNILFQTCLSEDFELKKKKFKIFRFWSLGWKKSHGQFKRFMALLYLVKYYYLTVYITNHISPCSLPQILFLSSHVGDVPCPLYHSAENSGGREHENHDPWNSKDLLSLWNSTDTNMLVHDSSWFYAVSPPQNSADVRRIYLRCLKCPHPSEKIPLVLKLASVCHRTSCLWAQPGMGHAAGFGFPGSTYLAKLARFWMTLAMRVSVREVWSSGYSCIRLKRLGDMMAGHRKRRNREALIRRSLMSCLPLFRHCCFQDANTSFSSRGNTLKSKRKKKRRNKIALATRCKKLNWWSVTRKHQLFFYLPFFSLFLSRLGNIIKPLFIDPHLIWWHLSSL